ncbi:maleylpyruvate isomerase family mycothiol-dependent enzyme [Kitasatospora sp. NPDC001603]|uniref:maleylpyruvate isomerase family mycothiol-dependent enzyme n=1 Tax=Kitasatospora sp. NPDC001603 TaxID=3154388 RepID=UPI00331B17FD
MTPLDHDRYCAEIVTQTDLLRGTVAGADLTRPVPSCPGWNVGQLLRHLGGGQRWAEETVRTRAAGPLPDRHFRDLAAYADEDPAVVGPWLTEGARRLSDALREAGPDAPLWTPVPGGTTAFYARRFTHETAVHRADATLALGAPFALQPDVARDGLDEWMELGSLPMHFEVHPRTRELPGPGRTLRFHATDPAGAEGATDWLVDLTGDTLAWRHADEPAAVTVSGPLTELLLLVYRRRPPGSHGVGVQGDADLLTFWLDRVGFG